MPGSVQMVEDNLRAAMRFFGEASGLGEVRTSGGAQMVYSGLDYGVFNIALLERPVASEHDLAAILAGCGRFYRERKARWSFWMCEDLLEPPARRHNREVFAEAGMRVISHAPGMAAMTLTAPSRPLPQIECRAVTDAASRAAFTGLTVTCFDIPMTVARAIYEPESAWSGAYRGFIAIVGGVPVSIVALVRAAGVLGVYSLGTAPEYRRKGYGEALLRAAARSFQAAPAASSASPLDSGEPLVLESTDAGYRLYRQLGFRDVTNFTVYLTR
jgi:ribosomal protein S18 acetylase RimI-like enzyme